ncbi:MAG: hypothetical protein C0168_11005 [Candidatus Aminicenantes bacterium]|nr:MAG: hypothetical protein C0168_11005 [Candidatus Aminicenantes bacterium]
MSNILTIWDIISYAAEFRITSLLPGFEPKRLQKPQCSLIPRLKTDALITEKEINQNKDSGQTQAKIFFKFKNNYKKI